MITKGRKKTNRCVESHYLSPGIAFASLCMVFSGEMHILFTSGTVSVGLTYFWWPHKYRNGHVVPVSEPFPRICVLVCS